jgi:hypothetical protein
LGEHFGEQRRRMGVAGLRGPLGLLWHGDILALLPTAIRRFSRNGRQEQWLADIHAASQRCTAFEMDARLAGFCT